MNIIEINEAIFSNIDELTKSFNEKVSDHNFDLGSEIMLGPRTLRDAFAVHIRECTELSNVNIYAVRDRHRNQDKVEFRLRLTDDLNIRIGEASLVQDNDKREISNVEFTPKFTNNDDFMKAVEERPEQARMARSWHALGSYHDVMHGENPYSER